MSGSATAPILETRDLTKKFGNFTANSGINLRLYRSSIHAVCGENGAGKSTMMKMLYGIYTPTSGEILIDGVSTKMTPQKAIQSGIGMVFQDFRLIPAFTAFENILMALPKDEARGRRKDIRKKIIEISQRYNIPVDPDQYVWEMDLGQRQRVEIVKVLMMSKTRLLIFDEPTSVLTYNEVKAFIEMLRKLRGDGYSIVLITHKLHEVISCADVISVLRHGVITDTVTKEQGFDKNTLIAKMMGEDVADRVMNYAEAKRAFDPEKAKDVLVLKDYCISDDHNRCVIKDINLTIKEGEILGVAGISGRGQKEFVETLFGLRAPQSGTLELEGTDYSHKGIHSRIDAGVALISEDPKRDNVVPGMSIYEHMVLAGAPIKTKGLGIDWSIIKAELDKSTLVHTLGVPNINRELETLSGGNIQRTMLARAILKTPKLLLASYPSRGLDIGTVEIVHQTLLELKKKGGAIILISEDLEELFNMSDRLCVIADNKVYGEFIPEQTTSLEIGELMLGGHKDE